MNYFEKKELAKSVPLATILEHEGITVRGGWCRSPFRDENTPSMKIFLATNTWCDYGLSDKYNAGDGINLIQKMYNSSFQEAVDYILAIGGVQTGPVSTPTFLPKKQPANSAPKTSHIIESINEISHPALTRYLASRCIPLPIAQRYCKEVHYFLPGRGSRFGIGFPNDNGGWVIRTASSGTYKGFKGDILASGISTIRYVEGSISPKAYVFEGFINYLSYVKLFGQPDCDVFVLNSANNASRMKDVATTGTRELYFYCDNDENGRKALQVVAALSGCEVHDESGIYASKGLNDLNDYHCSLEKEKRGN